jgi:ethanolamine utilization protein EutN
MQIALILGTAVATVKHATIRGVKLLVAQPLMADGRTPDADPIIAIDTVGAGRGERVVVSSDGKFTRDYVGNDSSPVRWAVIGICDDKTT